MAESYYTPENLRADNNLTHLIRRCAVLIGQLAEQRLELQPISMIQWMVLMQLESHERLCPTELSALLGQDLSNLTRIADELSRQGLVQRQRTEKDRRLVKLSLTPAGHRLALATRPVAVDLNNGLVEPFSTSETEVLISLLQRLVKHAQASEEGTIGGCQIGRAVR
jgi:DNA-binding MarR family transcriptional regulator